jgi:hypothetical protein
MAPATVAPTPLMKSLLEIAVCIPNARSDFVIFAFPFGFPGLFCTILGFAASRGSVAGGI